MRHDWVDGVDVELTVDDRPLQEYDCDDDVEPPGMCRYVEAVSGANFTVKANFDRTMFPFLDNDINCSVSLDGKHATARIFQGLRNKEICSVGDVLERINGTTYSRKFMFSELKTGDGPAKDKDFQELKGLGTVKVELIRCVKTQSSHGGDSGTGFKSAGGEQVPEKALKGRAISSRASLGAPQVSNSTWCCVDYPWGKNPFAVFYFKYRSHKDLQIEGIIARSPTPPPLEERDPATLTREELQELLRRRTQALEAAEVKRENVKREGTKRERSTTIINDDNEDEEISITGEGPSKRRRTSDDSAVEVVDLTED